MSKILVYDTDAQSRVLLKTALVSLGYEPVIASDGYAVVPLAEQHRPSAVVLDYKLPEADGFEILKRLRSVPAFALIPVVFASATPKFEIEMTIMDAPAVGYVDKPLDVNQLKAAIEDLVGPPVQAAAVSAPIPAPVAAPPMLDIPPPGAPLPPPAAPFFNGEPDLDGKREDVIDLD